MDVVSLVVLTPRLGAPTLAITDNGRRSGINTDDNSVKQKNTPKVCRHNVCSRRVGKPACLTEEMTTG
jgi:hypothetical protein